MSATFPFTAILGQETMQTALLLSAVDPAIGGVLVRGQKGTAKSTAVRALAAMLPSITVVANCPYHCDPDSPDEMHTGCRSRHVSGEPLPRALVKTPIVDLPLSTTEDRLVGTLHLESTLKSGQRQFEPGLLAAVHRGILYVDEVNLLPDHLVDILLDTVVSGTNLVEREGIQHNHPSRFILVGTMNPEEGELRPQFLDRFGLCTTIAGLDDPAQRREIVMHRLAFDRDPERFQNDFHHQEDVLRQQIATARACLNEVKIPDEIIDRAVAMAMAVKVQGHRAELALVRSARALAALFERSEVSQADLAAVAGFALCHRVPGFSVLAQSEIMDRIAGLLEADSGACERDISNLASGTDDEHILLMDNIDFPGSAAAGSMLFTYLKKKLKTGSTTPTRPLT
jgi:magnesium chelatase subunit I